MKGSFILVRECGSLVTLSLIAAIARNGVIGANGRLPWRLPGDMARFKALTMGKPMLMGRMTYESIGRPLPGRRSIVVTRNPDFAAEGVEMAADVEAGVALAALRAREMGVGDVAVVGGGSVFAALIDRADRLRLTEVEAAPEGDAIFPAIDLQVWTEAAREAHSPGVHDDCGYSFVDYARRLASN